VQIGLDTRWQIAYDDAMLLARKRLAAWIKRSELTQRAAARLLGIHYTYLNQILTGRRSPGLTNAANIEAITGIPGLAWVTTRGGRRVSTAPAVVSKANVGRV